MSDNAGLAGREGSAMSVAAPNWSTIFRSVPDFAAELRSSCEENGQEWSEWRWTGTRTDGETLDMAGVIVGGVRDGRMFWGRRYLEPVEAVDERIDAAVSKMAGRPPGGQ